MTAVASKTVATTQVNNKTASKQRKHSFWTKLLVIFVLIVIAILSPGGWALAYKGRIYPNVKIANISVGGMTREEAQKALEPKVTELKSNGPTLVYGEEKMNPSLEELGVTFDATTAVSAAFNYGRKDSLKQKVISYYNIIRNGAEIDLPLSVDQVKLQDYVTALASKITKEATNANITVVNGQIMVIPPKEGIGFDKEKILSDIKNFINNNTGGNSQITLEVTKIPATVQIEGTQQAVAITSKYLATAPIAITYNDKQWVADRSEIGKWMRYTPNGSILSASIDPSAFIKGISKEVTIPARARQIEDGTGQVLDEGQDGLGIDEKVLSAQIKNALTTGRDKTISLPVFDIAREQKIVYPHAMPGRYEGRYIDINLSEQTLYAFEGTALVNQFLISSGISSHRTPTGEFHVYSKSRVTEMQGDGYDLPGVEWVSWWYGDYSIHGTYWHHNFGHPMSHGCINASNGDAEWIYNWDDIGTPVYIHY